MVRDINPGTQSSHPGSFAVSEDLLYFAATHPRRGREIWVTDGTEAGTRQFSDVNPTGDALSKLAISGSTLFFFGDDGIHGAEPMALDL